MRRMCFQALMGMGLEPKLALKEVTERAHTQLIAETKCT